MLSDDRAAFEKVWTEFGAALKEGYHYDPKNHDKLNALSLWQSTGEGDWTTLAEYVERMKEGQEEIYVLLGKDLETLREAPQLERPISGSEEGVSRLWRTKTRRNAMACPPTGRGA